VLRDKLTVFSPHGGVFYRKGRKGFASFAKPLRMGVPNPVSIIKIFVPD
jgi:hypothetical protein